VSDNFTHLILLDYKLLNLLGGMDTASLIYNTALIVIRVKANEDL